jgi:hypothetical protein
MENSSKRRR